MKNLKTTFYVKKDKANQKGEVPVYLRISYEETEATYFTSYFVNPKRWRETRCLKLSRIPEEIIIRDNLDLMIDKIFELQKVLPKDDNTLNADLIKKYIKGEWEPNKTEAIGFLEAFDYHNKVFSEKVKAGDRSDGSMTKFLTVRKHLEEFIKNKYNKKDIDLKQLKFQFIENFDLFLRNEKSIKNNTTVKYIRASRKIVKGSILKYGWLDKDPFTPYEGRLVEIDTIYLTEEELHKIESKQFQSERLQVVKDIFVFCCYCGYAPADVTQLTALNLQRHVDGQLWLMKRRQKTKIECNVMLMPMAEEILNKYKDHKECLVNGTLLPKRSNQKINEYLKEIADVCGIQKELHHYVSRHTFGTLMLTKGVPLETVSKMMGHKRITQTQHYARLINSKVSSDLKAVKRKFLKKRKMK
jgi:site-specific recombinase XerD